MDSEERPAKRRPRDPYSGRRPRSGAANVNRALVDEDRLVLRYERDHWNLARCARRFRIAESAVRRILAEHEVPVREDKPQLDEDKVIKLYGMLGSVVSVGIALGKAPDTIRDVLLKHGIELHGSETMREMNSNLPVHVKHRAPTPRA